MSQPPTDETDDLQFDVAELDVPTGTVAAAAPPRVCAGCRRPIVGQYYALGDKLVCPNCRAQVDAPPPGRRIGRVFKATMLGLGAGLLGAVIWYAIRRATDMQIGLVAVAVGYMVGKAVRKGSGNRGGRWYQVLAVLLTYCCIAANYVPDAYQGLMAAKEKSVAAEHRHPSTTAPAAHVSNLPLPVKVAIRLAVSFVVSLVLPILMATKNPIGLLIIGFALWEAWKFTARRRLPITGPYVMGAPPIAGAGR
jgi:hypothetical protein